MVAGTLVAVICPSSIPVESWRISTATLTAPWLKAKHVMAAVDSVSPGQNMDEADGVMVDPGKGMVIVHPGRQAG